MADTSGAIDKALNADVADRSRMLLEAREGQWFDRKSNRIDAKKLAETLLAMANADGGAIVIGLHDGRAEGVNAAGSRINDWQQAPRDWCDPPVRARSSLLEIVNDVGAPDHVLVLDVAPSEDYHQSLDHHCFLRMGDENKRLDPQEALELKYDKSTRFYEVTKVPEMKRDDLDLRLLRNYASSLSHPSWTRLFTDRTSSTLRDITVAGCLLFGSNPTKFQPSALVRVTRYIGRTRRTGAHQQVVSDVRCEGPIPRVISAARAEVKRVQPTRRALVDGVFQDVATVPEDSWLEGIVNAVVHRSYSLQGDHIHIDVFDDRIEIRSPGRFPQSVNLERPLDTMRFARNPRIVRVCSDLKVCQEQGEGIRRMFEEMRAAGLTDPLYQQSTTTVTLTLSAEPVNREIDRVYRHEARRVLAALREHERMSTAELVKAAGGSRSRPWVRTMLESMKAADMIEWTGNSSRDPRAYWHLPRPS